MTKQAVVLRADARTLPLPDSSVDLIVTSPPYYGLRSYTDGGEHYAEQIGAESSPREYIASLIDCTREWMRVLKPSGSIFVNLGDKYANSGGVDRKPRGIEPDDPRGRRAPRQTRRLPAGIPPKSLMLLPERYRIAAVDELGLTARAVLVWSKPNGLPESVTDRVRRSHEDWVHLTKQPRYFAAMDAIREPSSPQAGSAGTFYRSKPSHALLPGQTATQHRADRPDAPAYHPLGKLPGSTWEIALEPLQVPEQLGVDHYAAYPTEWPRRLIQGWSPSGICTACGEGRRSIARSVGLDMSRPQARRAHELAERAGLTEEHLAALLSVGISDTGRGAATQTGTGKNSAEVYALAAEARSALGGYAREYLLRRPIGIRDTCACPDIAAPTRPAVVLDPFGGTGTTALVASVLGRRGITVDRSADYCRIAQWRTTDSGQRAKAARVAPPRRELDGQGDLFGDLQVAS